MTRLLLWQAVAAAALAQPPEELSAQAQQLTQSHRDAEVEKWWRQALSSQRCGHPIASMYAFRWLTLWRGRLYGLIWVPSAFLIGNLKPVPAGNGSKGYFAASFSSMSTPIPGASLRYIYPFFICGQPGKTS